MRYQNKIMLGFITAFMLATPLYPLSLGEIDTSSIDGIESAIGEIDSAIGDYWDIYDIDWVKDTLGLDNELLGCLVGNITLSDIITKPTVDGLCGTLGGASLSSIFSNPLERCGISLPETLNETEDILKDLCGDSETTTKTVWVWNEETAQWETTVTSDTTESGGWKVYDPISAAATVTVEDGVTGGTDVSGTDKKLEDRIYKNGKSIKEVLGDKGGTIIRNAAANPNGSDAAALRSNNTKTLVLKEMAAKLNTDGSTDESQIPLPATKLDVLKYQNAIGELIALSVPNLQELTDIIIREARKRYADIDEKTLDAYYKKEKETFMKMVKEDSTIVALITSVKQKAIDGIATKYAMKLFLQKRKKGYINDPSQTIAMSLKKNRDAFVFDAMMQNSEEAEIKGEEASEKRRVIMQIDLAVYNAYPRSSVFRPDIAKKEIDAMLSAVDTAIK